MEREKIAAMLADQEANMKRLQETALKVQGAIAVLREQLRQIDEAEGQEATDGE